MASPTCVVEERWRSRGIFVSSLGGRMDRACVGWIWGGIRGDWFLARMAG